MAFNRPIAFDASKDTIRWAARCTAADTIRLEVDTNSSFTNPIASIDVVCESGKDFVAKGEVGGLAANTLYYHRFVVNSSVVSYDVNPVGGGGGPASLKTAPPDDFTGTVKIVVGSCMYHGDGVVWEQVDGKAPDLYINNGDRVYVDTDSGNDPPTALSEFFDSYKLTHRNKVDAEARFMRYVLLKRAFKGLMDDHDHSVDDINLGNASFAQARAWAMQAFSAYTPHASYVNSDAQFRVERWGNIDLFFIDTRFKKMDPTTYARWPFDGSDNHVIEASSTRSQIVLKDGGTGHVTDKTTDAYAGWYMKVAETSESRTTVRPPHSDLWRRVRSSVQTAADEVTLTLDADLPANFDPATHQYLFMEKASMLDGGTPFQTGNQWEWLVDALRASTAKVKLIVSPHIGANNTQVGGDNWRAMSAQNSEIRTLYQMTQSVRNIFWLSGDMHRHMQDDGTNSEWPEVSCSPLDQDGATGAAGTWSHGQADRPTTNPLAGSSNGFALLTISDTEFKSEMFWDDASATPMGGITTMTIPLENEPGPPGWNTSRSDSPRSIARPTVDYQMACAEGLDPTGEDLQLGDVQIGQVVGGRVRWNATATAGERMLRMEVLEDFGSGDVVVGGYDLLAIPANGETTSELRDLLPPGGVWIHGGQKLRVLDDNGVDASDDVDLYLRLLTY